ncbi:MAG: DUF4003 domain-containing protein [Oscillospiraceae bacterium]|nr:DUF4003 domain-containing protein [Oscillospiraceae bacterium]
MLQNTLTLFASNARIIKKEFTWHNTLTKRMAALLYAQEGKPIDCESIRYCHNLIKQSTGLFSTFRGNMTICVATLLSLSPKPRQLFEETLKVYSLLKGARFRASDFLVVAAFEIAKQSIPKNFENVVNRARAFYDGMKANNFFHTGPDDYIFAAMLGLAEDLDVAAGTERIKQHYDALKGEFWYKNSVQALSHILVLGGSSDSADRVLSLRSALRQQKIKLDKSYTLSSLGVLSLLPVEIDAIVRDIGDARDYLRTQKGFSVLSVSIQELLLYAVAIVANEYAQSMKDGVLTATISTSITNIIIAQHVAMVAAISASTASAASSSSS